MPIPIADIKGVMVEEKEARLFSDYKGVNPTTGFNLKDDMKKKEIIHDIYKVEGFNQCRTEQGKRMVGLSEEKLRKALVKGHRQYIKAAMNGEWDLIGFMMQALISAESDLIVGKEK